MTLSRRNFLSFDFGGRGGGDDADHWVRVHRIAMACRFEVTLSSSDARQLEAARKALDEADRLESILSVFRDNSEVVYANRRAGQEAVHIGDDLYEILKLSELLYRDTSGAFDITATPLSRCWGFLRRDGRIPEPAVLDEAKALVGMPKVNIDDADRTVQFERDGVELNFGSIGKGFALDRMAVMLRGDGVRHALLSAGQSSIYAIGGRDGGWPIDLRPRLAKARIGQVLLRHGGMATSGGGEQFFEIEGVRYGHVLDPRTGWPASGVLGATVIARSAAVADAISTALLVQGLDLAEQYCAIHPNTLAVIIPDDSTQIPRVFGSYDGATVDLA